MDIAKILTRKFDGEFVLYGDDYEGLVWLSDTPKPTESEIVAKWDEVKAELEAEKQAVLDKKAAAEAKLAALGLDADDLKVLGLA